MRRVLMKYYVQYHLIQIVPTIILQLHYLFIFSFLFIYII